MAGRPRVHFKFYCFALIPYLLAFSQGAMALRCDPKHVLQTMFQKTSYRNFMIRKADEYNAMLKIPLQDEPHIIRNKIIELLNAAEPHTPAFDRKGFMKWLDQNPITSHELELATSRNETLGDFVHVRVQAFESKKPNFNFNTFRNEVDEKLELIRKKCGENQACHQKETVPWIKNKLSFSCLRNSAVAQRTMISNLIIYNTALISGYLKSPTEEEKLKGFPYELVLDRLLMSPIFSEIGCRNNLNNEQKVGKPVDYQSEKTDIKSRITRFGKSYWEYFKWSRLQEASYLGMHYLVDYAKGYPDDLSLEKVGKEYASLFVFDSIYSAASVLFIDPLYFRRFPQLKSAIQKMVPNQTLGQVIYTPIDLSTRWLLNESSNRIFQQYESKIRYPVENELTSDTPPAPAPSTKP